MGARLPPQGQNDAKLDEKSHITQNTTFRPIIRKMVELRKYEPRIGRDYGICPSGILIIQ